jgi:hypothetical protein
MFDISFAPLFGTHHLCFDDKVSVNLAKNQKNMEKGSCVLLVTIKKTLRERASYSVFALFICEAYTMP